MVWLNRTLLSLCLGKGMGISFLEDDIPYSLFTREGILFPRILVLILRCSWWKVSRWRRLNVSLPSMVVEFDGKGSGDHGRQN